MRRRTLSSWHYAAKWEILKFDQFNDVKHINQLGLEYALMEDGPAREERLFELIRCFHSYLMKYLDMITRGHLASTPYGWNRDTIAFLKFFINSKDKVNRASLFMAAKFLHLAFKEQDTDDIYEILVTCLLRAIRKYDPHYSNKLGRVINLINGLKNEELVIPREISAKLGFDCTKYIRLLSRDGLLAAKRERKTVVSYQKVEHRWPPRPKKYGKGPIGFVYVVQRWFRYFLKDFIERSLFDIEAKGTDVGYGLMQLDHRPGNIDNEDLPNERLIPDAGGELQDTRGQAWAADLSLINKSFDLNEMDINWVHHTADPIFRSMSPSERYILYARFMIEQPFRDIARALKIEVRECQRLYDEIMAALRNKAAVEQGRQSNHTNQEGCMPSLSTPPS
jgi:hypothetical protein